MARLVFLSIPVGKQGAVRKTLESEDIEYTLTEEISGREYGALAFFTLPTTAVEPVLAKLRDAGIDDESITVIMDTKTVISRNFEALESKYEEEERTEEQIASQELKSTVENLMPSNWVYLIMTFVSAIIAAAGLLLNSAAVVVGSMVIAPLIGPAMASNVGTVLNDRDLFVEGAKLQIIGIGLAILGAAIFAIGIRLLHLIPPGISLVAIDQIRERIRPDFLSLAIALGSGVAGVLSLSTGMSSALVGVMIAVALIPPAATVGLGIAWMQPQIILGSGVLLMVNIISINIAALGVLWYMGYQPQRWHFLSQSRESVLKQAGILVVSLLLLSVFLGGVTLSSYQVATTEQVIENDIQNVL
ncbi:MAG: TIGR00341 family protein, partial [Halobacteriaceae archaeon]